MIKQLILSINPIQTLIIGLMFYLFVYKTNKDLKDSLSAISNKLENMLK